VDGNQLALIVGASLGGGVMNALAGGGTILTYPALLFAGESAITANATSTVALWPGAATSLFGYRREVSANREWLRVLFLPSLLGGGLGAILLLRTPPPLFERMAPFLVLFATVLFMIQGWVGRRPGPGMPDDRKTPRRLAVAWLFQLGIGLYGGYFGAGIGILMLAVLGFLGLSDIHAANGIKNFFGLCINGVAAGWFILRGAVDWPAALWMIAAAMVGGYAGARLARRMGRARARLAVVVVGLLVTAILLWRQGWV
jgi:uncharacterized membrane protein YfcA